MITTATGTRVVGWKVKSSAHRIAVGLIILLFLSFHLWGVKVFNLGGLVRVAPWDLATLLVIFIWIQFGLRHRIPLRKPLWTGIIFMTLFVTWIVLQSLRSPDTGRAITMVGLMMRNFVLLVTIGTMCSFINDLARLNRVIFLLGVVIASLSIIIYLLSSDVVGIRRPMGGIGYILDSYKVPRLIGFARDPNFFAMFISVSLFCGLGENKVKPILKRVGTATILIALSLTISRTMFVAAPLAILSVWFLQLIAQRRAPRSIRVSFSRPIISLGIALIGLIIVLVILAKPLDDWTMLRFNTLADSPRFATWSTLTTDPMQLSFGKGLRGTESMLGGRYSHNSYLDILFDTGVIGLLLWAAFSTHVFGQAYRSIKRSSETVPWLQSFIMILIMMLGFSIIFHPIFWVISGILLGQSRLRNKVTMFKVDSGEQTNLA